MVYILHIILDLFYMGCSKVYLLLGFVLSCVCTKVFFCFLNIIWFNLNFLMRF